MKIFKAICLAVGIALILILGYLAGKSNAIHQAELLEITDTEYHIGFGDEIHTYTFE